MVMVVAMVMVMVMVIVMVVVVVIVTMGDESCSAIYFSYKQPYNIYFFIYANLD